jgi:hypothetical protein
MNLYIIMKKRVSPITINFEAQPHEIYTTKKEAEKKLNYLNSRATTNKYWIEKAPLKVII